MALHPQCKAFLDQLAAMGGRPLHELTPAEARSMALPPDLAGAAQPVHHVDDRRIPGPRGPILVRLYTPGPAAKRPALIYFHGGGFVLGNLDMCDRPCRTLANLAGCVVVSVEYRLAPEHKFPAAVDDAYAVTRHIIEHGAAFGIDRNAIAIGGESAGANLAAVTALRARDAQMPPLAFQLLVYPLVDFDDDSLSRREFADGHFLTTAALDYFARLYLAGPADRKHPHASPLYASDFAALPPAYIVTAECDPLRDQGETYASRLEQSGVRVACKRYDGMIHPFFSLAGIVDGGRTAIEDAAAALRTAFAGSAGGAAQV